MERIVLVICIILIFYNNNINTNHYQNIRDNTYTINNSVDINTESLKGKKLSIKTVDMFFPNSYSMVERALRFYNFEDKPLIKKLVNHKIKMEGFSSTIYRGYGSNHYPTVGYGHVISDYINFIKKYNISINDEVKISKKKALFILLDDIKREISNVRHYYPHLSYNQTVAVASLFFNIGSREVLNSSLNAKLNMRGSNLSSEDFVAFCHINGQKNKRLASARKFEFHQIFNKSL